MKRNPNGRRGRGENAAPPSHGVQRRRVPRNRRLGYAAALCAGVAVGVVGGHARRQQAARASSAESNPGRVGARAGTPATLSTAPNPQATIRSTDPGVGFYPAVDQLMALTDPELDRVDPVVVNLAVARGVPEFAELDVEHYARTLDAWAEEIRFDTERHWYRFQQNPVQFNHSAIEYKILWLCSDVNAVFKIDYDLADFDAYEPSNLFLNGLVDRKLGTCISMPMLYVALGWRLGYPIKAVPVPTHVFARWDDGQTRINIEATGYGADLPDPFYAAEYFVSARCKERGAYLASLTPRQTLAELLLSRADYWQRRGDLRRRLEDALQANILYPDCPLAIAQLADAWAARERQDNFYAQAVSDLKQAVRRLREREQAQTAEPIEKLIFTETGPVRILVDPETGETTPIE